MEGLLLVVATVVRLLVVAMEALRLAGATAVRRQREDNLPTIRRRRQAVEVAGWAVG
jgi:hypothetical protein